MVSYNKYSLLLELLYLIGNCFQLSKTDVICFTSLPLFQFLPNTRNNIKTLIKGKCYFFT